MASFLLAIIYLAFISLGLPDSLLGSGWPAMHTEIGAQLSYAGIISMIIAGGTIVSSLLSDKLTIKLGAGKVTAISTLLTAVALLGFSLSDSFILLCILSVPYGLGAGAIDAALNNYVALHYNSRHMSWLHCFWGVGASISPYIMSFALSNQLGWRQGYSIVSYIQLGITAILFFSLPLWKKRSNDKNDDNYEAPLKLTEAFKIKGVWMVLLSFLGYCGYETTCGLWASSYLNEYRGVDPETAAGFASFFYLGITFGRFLCGFIADRIGDKNMIRLGSLGMCLGILLILLPLQNEFALAGLLLTGFGAAPVYPSIIHATPDNFGKENSHAIIGIQMAAAYTGSTLMPPLFGFLGEHITMGIYPFYLLFFALLCFIMAELLNKKVKTEN